MADGADVAAEEEEQEEEEEEEARMSRSTSRGLVLPCPCIRVGRMCAVGRREVFEAGGGERQFAQSAEFLLDDNDDDNDDGRHVA